MCKKYIGQRTYGLIGQNGKVSVDKTIREACLSGIVTTQQHDFQIWPGTHPPWDGRLLPLVIGLSWSGKNVQHMVSNESEFRDCTLHSSLYKVVSYHHSFGRLIDWLVGFRSLSSLFHNACRCDFEWIRAKLRMFLKTAKRKTWTADKEGCVTNFLCCCVARAGCEH